MEELVHIADLSPCELYDRGLPRTTNDNLCERCQSKPSDDGGRFCDRCYDFVEAKHQLERENRQYFNRVIGEALEWAKRGGKHPDPPPARIYAPALNPAAVEVQSRPATAMSPDGKPLREVDVTPSAEILALAEPLSADPHDIWREDIF